ncbi:roadblock/LC7 domain-containing protein [Candidatus Sumerlaeota bacterium]|nr:roadblock/LC7 domain-containing protein [Candidatus Sumerlaeota bacterium]
MTAMNRNFLILLLAAISLIAVAMGMAGYSQGLTLGSAIIVIIIELFVYFIVSMLTNPRAAISMAFGSAVVYLVLRWICSFLGGISANVDGAVDPAMALGVSVHPLTVVIQVAILLCAGPYILAVMIPELVGAGQAATLRGDQLQTAGGAQARAGGLEMTPTGGFIQVFSFEELASMMKKSHGLEGFVIYSNEGLVVWKELPVQVQLDTLVAKVSAEANYLGQLMQDNGLAKVRRLMLESREHYLFATTLNQNFGILLLFSGRSAPEEIFSRIGVLAKSTREYLQWKYPSLAVSASAARDKVAMDFGA